MDTFMKATRIATIGRSSFEWIGRDNDSRPPKSVLLRILRRYNHRCHISGREIADGMAWQAEHIKPLWEGGENREANLAPALVDPHKAKSRQEAAQRAKSDRQGMGSAGLKQKPPGLRLQSRGFQKYERERRGVDKSVLPPLPRRHPVTGEIVG
jgi:5-methylcytosine-specific restriction enzyme A